ncbi:hypothetical protein ABTG19_04715 [Acinetobacter baumannii]
MLFHGRLDRTASAGRICDHGIPTPVQSVTITVGSNGVGLKLNLITGIANETIRF